MEVTIALSWKDNQFYSIFGLTLTISSFTLKKVEYPLLFTLAIASFCVIMFYLLQCLLT